MSDTTFAAFHPVSDTCIREAMGLWFEQFAPGQVFDHRPGITVSQTANANEALASLNQAMIHFDHHYAEATEFGVPLVVSTLTLQYAIGLGWKTFGRRRRILGFSSIRLIAPVRGGDTLYARSRIIATAPLADDPDCGAVEAVIALLRPDGATIADIGCTFAIYRHGTASGLPASFGA
ncbi:MaoC/PaaZ C-terminal domain-containing protein [Devosia ginsengisoli]|uniref:MaoC/PaaZ C-terminal domain-containing protein n=1 Tax=Devosia ginsengisoli TaxID=400770 RepID=UPI0026EBE6B5|nr:MaoC/PaaZ C-terminal domain-containing protein [Devosia ginsengisoli]MCR6670140.1 MaoC/PaaZ C-terminal domain-containing protein [Devosia ginsengisoli]